MEQPILRPSNPYVGTLRVFPGTLVKVSGRPKPNATRFAINFQTGPSLNPRDDLALHLSPCFTPPRIVRNSLIHGAWGLEEAWGNGVQLNPHQPFEMIILAEADQFKIAINGSHFCEFKHRIPYHEITHLTIDGDVDIDQINVTSSPYGQPSYQPNAPPHSSAPSNPPYPTNYPSAMPAPPSYPVLPSGPYAQPASASGYPSSGMQGPMPAASSYASGYPQGQPGAYPSMPPGQPSPYPAMPSGQPGPYPAMPSGQSGYPTMPAGQPGPYPVMGGPSPAGARYQDGFSHNQQPQPGHSSSSTFGLPIGGKALGTLAGLGLGAAAGAAALSALNPLKKVMKPKKLFKHKGWGRSSSSSSNSSRSSFSSNSS